MKKVSIIIPCYNQASFLEETLKCILSQDYANWECILINDGSTDNTEEIILRWTEKDSRFCYFSIPNGGVSVARNYGIEKANGIFIQFLDADDLLASDKLSKSVKVMQSENVAVVCSNYDRFEGTLANTLGAFSCLNAYDFTFQNIARYWNSGFTIPIHCFFFKRDVIGDFRFPVGITAQEDWVMWLQVYQQNPKTYFRNEILAYYRSNPLGRTNTGGLFEETLFAIDYLSNKLSSEDFKILYQSVIMRFEEASSYWRKREENLKQSHTYQLGLLCKKVVKKFGLLPLAKKIFVYLALLKR
ncbi:glycosyltransferase family 2 protein [Flavobacterium sp.]|uniref:glycosyltransferase family 2 protein n=1 Tax=Flavobacterium sp. TaxID=239 RepID=UPI003D144C04